MIWESHYYGIDDEVVEKAKGLWERLGVLSNNGRLTHTANSIRGYIINDIANASGLKKLEDGKFKDDKKNHDDLKKHYHRVLKQLIERDFDKAIKFLNKHE